MAPLKTSPRRTSGLLSSCTWTKTSLGCSCSSVLHGWAPEGLKDLVVFYMKRLFREHSHQKAKERSHLPGFAITEIFCQWWSKPLPPAWCQDSMEKAWVYVHKEGKGAFAEWCLYLQSTFVVALQIFRDEDFRYTAPPVSQGSSVSPVPRASERAGILTGFRHLV